MYKNALDFFIGNYDEYQTLQLLIQIFFMRKYSLSCIYMLIQKNIRQSYLHTVLQWYLLNSRIMQMDTESCKWRVLMKRFQELLGIGMLTYF